MAGQLLEIHLIDAQFDGLCDMMKKDEQSMLKTVFKATVKPLQKEAQKEAKKATHSKTLYKGVRVTSWKSKKGASVFIRSPYDPYYKLLFFEGGTVGEKGLSRIKKGTRRGSIAAKWFFKNAAIKYTPQFPHLFTGEFTKVYEKKVRTHKQEWWAREYARRKGRSE